MKLENENISVKQETIDGNQTKYDSSHTHILPKEDIDKMVKEKKLINLISYFG